MPIPNLVYNEERPQFIGKDVEGIKELNTVLANKYDINKRAKIESEDLLHSFRTLDKDQPHLTQAIQGFDEELQFISENNQYERAGQVVEKAVTNIKRNKALEQSVGNYGAYQSYVNDLKENPNGWTDQEISSVIGFSAENYSGVTLDENGQATGIFNGYNPGEKINVLTEFDEALKGFASDKGVEFSAVQNMLADGTQKAISKTTTETVDRNELIAYLKQYYGNDPKINKYYETQTILDSRKSGRQLATEISQNIGRLDLFSVYGSKYKRYLKDTGVVADNQAIDAAEFVSWMVNQETGANYDIPGLMRIAAEEGEDSALAKQKLAQVNNILTKNLDLEAAAVKNGFTKQDIKLNIFSDQMALYRLKKLEEGNETLYSFQGSAVPYNNQYTSGAGGTRLLTSNITDLQASIEVTDEQIASNLRNAEGVGDYDSVTQTWTNPNSPFKIDNDRYQRERNVRESELNLKSSYLDAADEYANNKLNKDEVFDPARDARTQERLIDNITEDAQKLREELANEILKTNIYPISKLNERKITTLNARIDFYDKSIADINNKGVRRFSNELSEEAIDRIGFNFLPKTSKEIVGIRSNAKQYRNLKQEYLDNNSIPTFTPTIVHIDEEANPNLVRAMDVVEDNFVNNNAAYVIRDQNGTIIANPKDRPAAISINGMSTGRFSDGKFYYEATGVVYDEDGKQQTAISKGSPVKYYVDATPGSVTDHIGAMMINNKDVGAAALGYQLATPLGFRFRTENIALANNPVPVESDDGNDLGTVKIHSSTTGINGAVDLNSVFITYNLNPSTLKSAKKLYPNVTATMNFATRAAFEEFLNNVNNTVNTDKK